MLYNDYYDCAETRPLPCLPTYYINNDTLTEFNVSLILLNAFGDDVGNASPALSDDRWKVPNNAKSLELKILETCVNPRISWLKFTVEGVFALSIAIDNETIIHRVRT